MALRSFIRFILPLFVLLSVPAAFAGGRIAISDDDEISSDIRDDVESDDAETKNDAVHPTKTAKATPAGLSDRSPAKSEEAPGYAQKIEGTYPNQTMYRYEDDRATCYAIATTSGTSINCVKK